MSLLSLDLFILTRLFFTTPERKRPRPPSLENISPPILQRVRRETQGPRHLQGFGRINVLSALRRLYRDPEAQFRTERQREAVESVASRTGDVVAILPTGGGKSLLFLVPLFLPRARTTIVVVPLVALKQDMVRPCWEAEIEFSVWEARANSERFVGLPFSATTLHHVHNATL